MPTDTMTETSLITNILDKGVTAGLLAVAVYFVAKKLATVYEARIAALELASKVCEEDRKSIRDTFIKHLTKGGAVTVNLAEGDPK